LAQEQDSTESDSRALKVVSQEDEMWASGMQAALDAENMNGYEDSDEEDDDEEGHDEEKHDEEEGG